MAFDFCFRLFMTLVLFAIFIVAESIVARMCIFFFDEKVAARSAFYFCNVCLVLCTILSVLFV